VFTTLTWRLTWRDVFARCDVQHFSTHKQIQQQIVFSVCLWHILAKSVVKVKEIAADFLRRSVDVGSGEIICWPGHSPRYVLMYCYFLLVWRTVKYHSLPLWSKSSFVVVILIRIFYRVNSLQHSETIKLWTIFLYKLHLLCVAFHSFEKYS